MVSPKHSGLPVWHFYFEASLFSDSVGAAESRSVLWPLCGRTTFGAAGNHSILWFLIRKVSLYGMFELVFLGQGNLRYYNILDHGIGTLCFLYVVSQTQWSLCMAFLFCGFSLLRQCWNSGGSFSVVALFCGQRLEQRRHRHTSHGHTPTHGHTRAHYAFKVLVFALALGNILRQSSLSLSFRTRLTCNRFCIAR